MNAILTKEEWETMPGGLFDQANSHIILQGLHISQGNQIYFYLQGSHISQGNQITLYLQGTQSETLTVCRPALLHCLSVAIITMIIIMKLLISLCT